MGGRDRAEPGVGKRAEKIFVAMTVAAKNV